VTFTTPRTWVAGEVVTAAMMNANIRDNMNAVTGASVAFGTAASIWTASGTNPAIGNGTFNAWFRQDNKWVDITYIITMGSTTTYGSGTWQLGLPATARLLAGQLEGRAIDSSGSTTQGYAVTCDLTNTSLISLRCSPTVAGNVDRVLTSTQPFTWAVNDVLTVTGRYEAA
jgi:hypothetical protein